MRESEIPRRPSRRWHLGSDVNGPTAQRRARRRPSRQVTDPSRCSKL